jgi:diphthine synthase
LFSIKELISPSDFLLDMLYFIGLGLADVDDLTIKGLRIIKNCQEVYLETYTTILQIDQKTLEEHLGIQVIPADRELVELSAGKYMFKILQ